MMNTFQGDPYLTLTADGADLTFTGGQPVMDQGLENQASISLFTAPNWAGNFLFDDTEQQIGSEFEEEMKKPITRSSLASGEKVAEKALESPLFGTVTAEITNPNSNRRDVAILIEPPAQNKTSILLTNNGQNWINQAEIPAHGRV